ncbi:unnamed protein product [Candidula unifasciata]|uniref:Metal response element binding transcription factor 2 n=1 Tax=Candidula unifasciata TaxID=100452 RepID=A0A8S3ZRK2_9EUPU|nr:unnamed protein product [Candidula unifasciata]
MKPRKIEKKKLMTSPLRLKIKKDMLLARWTDGLFYCVKITKISDTSKTCVVEFEDKSVATVQFKDLLGEKEEGVTVCHSCGKEEVEQSNALIKCENYYHQLCHIPPFTPSGPDDKFVCRICVFTSCAQTGGAKKSGPLAFKFAEMKQYFPYDIKYLTWNATHTSNVEQCFCYCGGPGIWYNKMLQCCRCRQWFHEACLQCLDEELLIGDRFFIFTCAHCNYGVEYIQRMDLSWFDITYVTLFHLIMTLGKRYIDLESDLAPFILSRADSFGLKKLLNGHHGSRAAVCNELVKVLQKHTTQFCCGAEVKKRCTFYGIRERIPPCPSPVSIPALDEVITEETLTSNSGKKVLFTPSKYTLQVPYVLRGSNRVVPPTMGAKLRESKLAKIARVKSEHNYCTPIKCVDDSFSRDFHKNDESSWESFDANNNSPSVQAPPKLEMDVEATHGSGSSRQEAVEKPSIVFAPVAKPKSSFWSLDTAFPEPMNFTGANHPFLTEFEQESLRKQRQHFENQLEILSTFLLEEDEQKTRKKANPVMSPISSPPSAVKGFKGELADLIKSTCRSSASSPLKTKCLPDSSEFSSKDEKLFDRLNPPKNGVLSRRNRLSQHGRNSKSAKAAGSPSCSRTKVSPKKDRISLKNGISCIKSEPSTWKDTRSEDSVDKAAQKRLKALRRCLKKLSPTCGFRFPVLEESHTTVTSAGQSGVLDSVADSPRPPGSASATPLSAPTEGAHARPTPSSLSKSGNKSRKRKLKTADFSQVEGVQDQCSQNIDSVRRSHRSRSVVQRFQAASGSRCYGMTETVGGRNGSLSDGEQYDVISLRIRQEDGLVEYLIGWSQ